MKQSTATYEYKPEGSFVHGFTIGMLAGAVGYYLFATDKGSKLRKELVNEWQEAKKGLAEQGLIEDQNVGIREFIYSLVEKVAPPKKSQLELTATTTQAIEKKPQSQKTQSSKSKDTSKKFKGV